MHRPSHYEISNNKTEASMTEYAEEPNKSDRTDEKLQTLANDVEALYKFRDYYFEHHPIEMASKKDEEVEAQATLVLHKFNEIDENSLKGQQKAQFYFLKGKVYNIGVKYDQRATQCLSKAVKLSPRMTEGWSQLAESYWKNKNLKEAKNSLEGALQNERNKVLLRNLSIILRQEPTAKYLKLQDVQKSVDLAKEAVSLDIKDGISWTILGNAYLSSYFNIAQSYESLKQCMSAYKQAESDPVARAHPDLSFNRGMALKYTEKYDEALRSLDFSSKLDPNWPQPIDEKNKMEKYLLSIDSLIRTKGKIKTKKLQQMVASLNEQHYGIYIDETAEHNLGKINTKLEKVTIDGLVDGPNTDKIILGRVVGSVYNESVVPFAFALVDSKCACVCVTLYNMAAGRGVVVGDAVAIPAPIFHKHSFTIDDKCIEFESIRVDNPLAMMVNGKRMGRENVAENRITTKYNNH